jgi:hypothetical protein
MAAYRKQMAKFFLKLPSGPQDELCAMFEGLRLDVVAPPKRAQPRNSWISAPTWALSPRTLATYAAPPTTMGAKTTR